MLIIATPILSFERHQGVYFYFQNQAFKDGQLVQVVAPPIVLDGTAYIPLNLMKELTSTQIGYFNNGFYVDHTQRDKPEIYFDENATPPYMI